MEKIAPETIIFVTEHISDRYSNHQGSKRKRSFVIFVSWWFSALFRLAAFGYPWERTSSIRVTSGGARKRMGGPQVPDPRLTYSQDRFASWVKPACRL